MESVESKMTPRLRAEGVGVMMAFDGMRRLVRNFGKLSRKTNEEKFRFGLVK